MSTKGGRRSARLHFDEGHIYNTRETTLLRQMLQGNACNVPPSNAALEKELSYYVEEIQGCEE
eukprot:29171-Eustigmatos_ZCMA.PRE.1